MKPDYSKGRIFCNNNECQIKDTCFRFMPKHSKAKDLFEKLNDSAQCDNYIEWNLKSGTTKNQ